VGITIVKNGEIKDTIVRLIQPPQNKYDWGCINVHHITPENTLNSPTFDIVWEEIKQLFQNTIVAHNAAFDEAVLRANLDYYGIDHTCIPPFLCTYKIYGLSLDKLCYLFDIPLDNHHDAGFDACCCAKFYLNHLNGIEVDCSKLQSMPAKVHNAYHTRLTGNILQKDLSNADPLNPFYNKKVVITGVFDIDRRELAAKLKSLGADIDTGISKCTNFVFVGQNAGPSKIAKIKSLTDAGYSIVTLGQEDAKYVMENNYSLIQ
jgi:DNA polymerase-3 subunit epsilon